MHERVASMSDDRTGFVKGLFFYVLHTLGGLPRAIWISLKYKPDIIYGYEIWGVPIAFVVSRLFKVSRLFNKKFITKFQGTVAYFELEKGKAWSRIPHHLLSLKMPADLIIMDNDGTRGLEALILLGVKPEKIRFWMDGLDNA
jgi:hypothetical protein